MESYFIWRKEIFLDALTVVVPRSNGSPVNSDAFSWELTQSMPDDDYFEVDIPILQSTENF